MPRKMNLLAKRAKAAADAIDALVEGFGEKMDSEEVGQLMVAHALCAQIVSHNGGPAWNAEDQTWEF